MHMPFESMPASYRVAGCRVSATPGHGPWRGHGEGAVITSTSRTAQEQIERANTTGRTPVVFIHGLWLLASSWDRWAAVFEDAGYAAVQPGWPDDPDTVAEAKQHPDVFAHKRVGQVADHYAQGIGQLKKKPAVIGHSFGGLLAQIMAGRGLPAAAVAIHPPPLPRGPPPPLSSLESPPPGPRHPPQPKRAVGPTYPPVRCAVPDAL